MLSYRTRTRLLLSVLFICHVATAQTPSQQDRLQLAAVWLRMLGVSYQEDISKANVEKLKEAFDAWISEDSSTPSPDGKKSKSLTGPVHILPSVLERMARMPAFTADEVRTPNSVLINDTFVGNPDHGLLSLGGALNLGELYISPEARSSACDLAEKAFKDIAQRRECRDPTYLSGTRKIDFFGRLARLLR